MKTEAGCENSGNTSSHAPLQMVVFALVSASFVNLYLTQPVLPVLQNEFEADMVQVSLTVSVVILGIALSNLPFGALADRWPIQPIILTGAVMVSGAGLVCAVTPNLWVLIGARFVQGLFIPALTTCLAAYLAKTLPVEKLNVVMGSYVSATVVGGLGGRLLGGWIHPPLHWRYAFVSAAILILTAAAVALRGLPRSPSRTDPLPETIGFKALLNRRDLLRLFFCAAGSFAVFSSIFNYLPFRLHGPPFGFSTEMTTLIYMVYIMGIFMGPTAGRISNRFGAGTTLLGGTIVLGGSLLLLVLPNTVLVVLGLLGVCAGFFAVHASAVGALNRKLMRGQGRANALYVLLYYIGGWSGITAAGFIYKYGGWTALLCMEMVVLIIPAAAGLAERRDENKQSNRGNR